MMVMSEIIFIEQTDTGGRSMMAAGIFPIRHFLEGKMNRGISDSLFLNRWACHIIVDMTYMHVCMCHVVTSVMIVLLIKLRL